jgi:hypothetical protein
MSEASPESFQKEAVALSLAEQDIIACEERLGRFFTGYRQHISVNLSGALQLLEANSSDFAYAARDCGYLDASMDRLHQLITDGEDGSYKFKRHHLDTLNRHPYIRTVGLQGLIGVLNLSGTVIRESVAELGMVPAMPAGIMSTGGNHLNSERFNKDQIVQINAHAKAKLTPPEDVIAEDRIVEVTKISGIALRDIKRKLGISPKWFKNPSNGEGQAYLTDEEAALVLLFIKDPEFRRSQIK